MADVWPWLAVAGLGALNGLSPANGWILAAACGVHARDEAEARRALRPIALGQVASMAALAGAFWLGMSPDRVLMRNLAGAMLVAVAAWRWLGGSGERKPVTMTARHAAIALWSFLMASAQGAGLMLVPALVPICAGGAGRDLTVPGPFAVALAAVAVHTAAMLLAIGLVATGICRGVGLRSRLPRRTAGRWVWSAALAVTGAGLMTPR